MCEEIWEMPIHIFAVAARAPATGVRKPMIRTGLAARATISIALVTGSDPCSVNTIPEWMIARPADKRNNRRPAPGQPSANVENSRCIRGRFENTRVPEEFAHLKFPFRDHPFRGSELEKSALHRGCDCMCSIVGVKLREYLRDMALHGIFGKRKAAGDLLIGVASRNQTQHLDFA